MSTASPEIVVVSEKSIPEVVAFLKAQKAIDEWKAKHAKALGELAELVAPRNAQLLAADAAVRALKVTCGPFELRHYSRRYDAEAFDRLVGRQKFAQLGGVRETKEVLSIEKVKFDAFAAGGRIPEAVVDAVRSWTPSYSAPKGIVLP